MNEIQKRAAEALSAAGYRYDEQQDIWRRGDIKDADYCEADITSPHFASLSVPTAKVAAMVSPSPSLSLEEIRKAVHAAVFAWVQYPSHILDPHLAHELVNNIMAHLQQHTQTAPTPPGVEQNAKAPDGFYLSVSPDALVLATRPDYVVGIAPPGVPQRCPVTDLPFFSIELNPDGSGYVPTYGGPFDSFTIPRACEDEEGAFERRHYDHDAGSWVEGWERVPDIVIQTAVTTEEGNDE